MEQKAAVFKTQGPIDKLNAVNAEIETLTNDLKQALRHLQKPFIKMQALATSGGGGGVTPDELSKVTQYLDHPLEALSSEPPGYPMLKEILEKLERLLTEDKLKLKDDKARKAEQATEEILKQDSYQTTMQNPRIGRDKGPTDGFSANGGDKTMLGGLSRTARPAQGQKNKHRNP